MTGYGVYPQLKHLGSVWKAKTSPDSAFYQDPRIILLLQSRLFHILIEMEETEAETLEELDHEGCIKLLHCFLQPQTGNLSLIQEFCNLEDLSSEKGSIIFNGAHFFRDGTKVVTWQGGKSTLERNKYVIDLMCYSDRQHALRSACRDSQQQAISLLKLKKQHGRRR